MKRMVQEVLNWGLSGHVWAPLTRDHLAVFNLHRFAVPGRNFRGLDQDVLRKTLERFRHRGCHLVALDDAIRHLREPGSLPPRSVAFTIDDGYAEVADVAAEIFLAYDCPVSVFLTTGHIDGQLWPWWDQVEFVCLSTKRRSAQVSINERVVAVLFDDEQSRRQAAATIWEHCKQVSEDVKLDLIRRLAAACEVDLPADAPPDYAALTWAEARALERRGIRFGPHAVSHPILARTTDAQSHREITESWERVKQQLSEPIPIFAYPNGQPGDFGRREMDQLEQCGFVAALTTVRRYASHEDLVRSPQSCYALPRFGDPDNPERACLTALGFDRILRHVRPRGDGES